MRDFVYKCFHQFFISRHYISTSSKAFIPRIYTRTGDKGTSSTFSGERRNKDDSIFEALGTTDELTSTIGFAREFLPETCENINKQLQEIQCILQDLASAVATPKSSSNERQAERTKFPIAHVDTLETWIDDHTKMLPPLNNFILPSGGPGSSALHMARTICRRAERRLSDYLFTVARVTSIATGREEFVYRKLKPKVKSGGDV
ncbi:hypothetical protein JTE90_021810 [Oedothorax gibbosus]|uniref:Corrinoid adenosyltransferase MMAB n=1 Tax=Oedothorax gibbosus TaxID=931172 RepID=A0AAV6TXF3_9ARAC|nr:hypothetical protein JTE90_021810 [Oedothorax gibbosus]